MVTITYEDIEREYNSQSARELRLREIRQRFTDEIEASRQIRLDESLGDTCLREVKRYFELFQQKGISVPDTGRRIRTSQQLGSFLSTMVVDYAAASK